MRRFRRYGAQLLSRRKSELPAAEFVDRFFYTALHFGHVDLFDDVPLLPRSLCEQIIGYPFQEGYKTRTT